MSGPQATFGIDITANDKTAKGAKSAEKRVGQIPKRAGDVSKASQGLLGTLGKVEEAAAKAFGGKSLTSGLTKRLSAVKEAASAAGTGLGEAATAGSALSSAMGVMGVVAAGTVGVLAAAGYAAFKFADSWAQGAASIGRTALTIGVATKALQEFQAAGERAGVDKGASTSALNGVAQTFNDARYGRNQEALALMTRLGIRQRLGADGQLDTVGMNNDLASAISRQKNAQTRRMIASKFGISDAALPMYLNGGAALSADMKDADSTALVLSDSDVAKGMRIARKGATIGQMKDRALGAAGSLAADGQEAGYDATIGAGRASFGGVVQNTFAPAAATIGKAATAFSGGVSRFVAGLTSGIIGAAQAATVKYRVPTSVQLAQYGQESQYGLHMPKGSNNPFGIKAHGNQPYVLARTTEEDAAGHSYYTMAKFRKFGSVGEAIDEHAKLLAGKRYSAAHGATSADGYADALTGVYATDHRYGQHLKKLMNRDHLRQYDIQDGAIPVKVEVHLVNAPPGTKATATAGRKSPPAVSHALQH